MEMSPPVSWLNYQVVHVWQGEEVGGIADLPLSAEGAAHAHELIANKCEVD
jgi:hypothetical protein